MFSFMGAIHDDDDDDGDDDDGDLWKKAHFIGSLNKMFANFANVQ